jgi:Fe2+ transport system protein FeoA
MTSSTGFGYSSVEVHKPSVEIDGQPLASVAATRVMVVSDVGAVGDDGVRLKRMGICNGRRIQVVQCGDPLIVRVAGCRLGISKNLARWIWVKPCQLCSELRDSDKVSRLQGAP